MDAGVIAVFIPVVAIICGTVLKMQKIKSAANQLPSEDLERLDALEHEMTTLRQELSETQERLDFTERLLSRGRESASGGSGQ